MTRKGECNWKSNSFVTAAEQVCLQPVLEHRQRRGRRNFAWQAIPHLCSSNRKGTTSDSWPLERYFSWYWMSIAKFASDLLKDFSGVFSIHHIINSYWLSADYSYATGCTCVVRCRELTWRCAAWCSRTQQWTWRLQAQILVTRTKLFDMWQLCSRSSTETCMNVRSCCVEQTMSGYCQVTNQRQPELRPLLTVNRRRASSPASVQTHNRASSCYFQRMTPASQVASSTCMRWVYFIINSLRTFSVSFLQAFRQFAYTQCCGTTIRCRYNWPARRKLRNSAVDRTWRSQRSSVEARRYCIVSLVDRRQSSLSRCERPPLLS